MVAGADAATQRRAAPTTARTWDYAFQIADDVLDYTADPATMGKNLGDDLAEGKATLPLIHAMQHSDAATPRRAARGASQQIVVDCDTGAMPEVLAGDPRQRRPRVQPRACAEGYAHATRSRRCQALPTTTNSTHGAARPRALRGHAIDH